MAEEGSIHEFCLWENQSWPFLNTDADDSSDNSLAEKSDKSNKTPVSSNANSPTGTETKEHPPRTSSSKKRGRDGSEAAKGGSSEAGGEHDIHILTERERRKKMREMFSNLHALLPQLSQKLQPEQTTANVVASHAPTTDPTTTPLANTGNYPPYGEANKSTIVDEAVNYIKTLESSLQRLQKQKLERLQSTTSFNIDPSSSSLNYNSPPLHTLIPYKTKEAFLAGQGSSKDNGYLVHSGKSSLNSSPLKAPPMVAFQVWTFSNLVLTVCGDEAQFTICSAKKFGTLSAILFMLEKYKIEVLAANVSSDSNRSIYMIQAHAKGAQDQFMQLFSVEDIYKQAAIEIMQWTAT